MRKLFLLSIALMLFLGTQSFIPQNQTPKPTNVKGTLYWGGVKHIIVTFDGLPNTTYYIRTVTCQGIITNKTARVDQYPMTVTYWDAGVSGNCVNNSYDIYGITDGMDPSEHVYLTVTR